MVKWWSGKITAGSKHMVLIIGQNKKCAKFRTLPMSKTCPGNTVRPFSDDSGIHTQKIPRLFKRRMNTGLQTPVTNRYIWRWRSYWSARAASWHVPWCGNSKRTRQWFRNQDHCWCCMWKPFRWSASKQEPPQLHPKNQCGPPPWASGIQRWSMPEQLQNRGSCF